MRPSIDLTDALTRDVGIQLRRADARMSEQFLNDAQVGAALQEVGRERMAEGVRAHPGAEARRGRSAFHDRPRLLAREPPATPTEEERAAARRGDVVGGEQRDARTVAPCAKRGERDLADR